MKTKYGVYENVDKSRFVHFTNDELPKTMGANASLVGSYDTLKEALIEAGLEEA
jgi:hypothetical protein